MPNITSLIETENAFSAMASADGIRKAFITFLANEGIIFAPHPVNGKQWYEEHPDVDGYLYWEPAFAELSRSGDLGYTTGPWEYRQNPKADATSFGYFVSIWKIQPGNEWKVVADMGIQVLSPVSFTKAIFLNNLEIESLADEAAFKKTAMELDELINFEKEFISDTISNGAINCYKKYLNEKTQLFRMRVAPSSGDKALQSLNSDNKKYLSGEIVVADVSMAGDLGYVLGTMTYQSEDNETKAMTFLRIWKKQASQNWKLLIDIAN